MKVVVTGASKGIGFETAKAFLKEGHQVFAISRNEKSLSRLKEFGADVCVFDLLSPSYEELMAQISAFGKIDILINNAGLLVNKPFSAITDQDLNKVFGVNILSVFRLTRDILPHLSAKAHVLNISSVGGVQGSMKFSGLSAYSSSKGSLSILTECLAEEFKETSLRFNALALGAVQTEMLKEAFPDYQAPISAKQMADYIVRFAISDALYYNGKVISVSSTNP